MCSPVDYGAFPIDAMSMTGTTLPLSMSLSMPYTLVLMSLSVLGQQATVWINAFILEIPGYISCNSSKIVILPCGGMQTQVPHRTHPLCRLRSFCLFL